LSRQSASLARGDALKASLTGFVKNFSIEVTPGGARRIADFRAHLPEGT
jgi:hypothetical protein